MYRLAGKQPGHFSYKSIKQVVVLGKKISLVQIDNGNMLNRLRDFISNSCFLRTDYFAVNVRGNPFDLFTEQ